MSVESPTLVVGEVQLPPTQKEEKEGKDHGDHVGTVQESYSNPGNWRITRICLDKCDPQIKGVLFESAQSASDYLAVTYRQIQYARNSSPVPDEFREHLRDCARYIQDEERTLRKMVDEFKFRARFIQNLADKYGVSEVDTQVEASAATMVRKVLGWSREGSDAPFFSEGNLYELIGKEDARTLRVLMRELINEIDPLAIDHF